MTVCIANRGTSWVPGSDWQEKGDLIIFKINKWKNDFYYNVKKLDFDPALCYDYNPLEDIEISQNNINLRKLTKKEWHFEELKEHVDYDKFGKILDGSLEGDKLKHA